VLLALAFSKWSGSEVRLKAHRMPDVTLKKDKGFMDKKNYFLHKNAFSVRMLIICRPKAAFLPFITVRLTA